MKKQLLEIVEAVGDKAAAVKGRIDPKSVNAPLLTPLAEGVEALADVVKQILTMGPTDFAEVIITEQSVSSSGGDSAAASGGLPQDGNASGIEQHPDLDAGG
jgi:hypothetical protein